MSWFSALPTGAATRSGNLEAREQRRAEIEAERLLKKQKSEQRKQLLSLGVSAPSSPSLSRAPTPPLSSTDRVVESAPASPGMNQSGQPAGAGHGGNQNPPPVGTNQGGHQGPPPQQPPPGGPPAGPPPPGPPAGPPPPGPPGGPGGPNPPPAAANGDGAAARPDYDLQDTADGPRALDRSASLLVQIELEDIQFWFSQLESEMLLSGIGSQWLKLSVLRKNLPLKQREDLKSLLRLPQSQAGPHPYYDAKQKLLKLYSVKPKDRFKTAMGRVLVGLPSQLGCQLIDDICDKPDKLRGCCCAKCVQALWTAQLPVNINQHVSNMDFNADTYLQVFEAADRAFLSSKTLPTVAAIASPPPAGYSISADANDPLNTAFSSPQVAATTRGGGRGGNRGGRGRGRGGNRGGGQPQNKNQNNENNQQKPRKGPRHSSNPPHSCCDNHFVFGDQSWFCQAPLKCPWKDKVVERP